VTLIGGYSGRLADGGERVRLQRPDAPPDDEPTFIPRLLEDETRYDDQAPWPAPAAGFGESLTRYTPAAWGHAATSWTAAAPTPGVMIPLASPLLVSRFTPTPSGFVAEFNEPFDASQLNLYDIEAGTLGPADVIVVGDTTGPVNGSLHLDGDSLTFIATGGLLASNNYTVTLRSAADALRAQTGELLDGDNDGSPGGDYQTTFVAAAPPAVVVSLPDFARGPGQDVKLPADGTGLPVLLIDGRSGGAGITSILLAITYDPTLLTITGAVRGPDAPLDTEVLADTDTSGRIVVTLNAPTTPVASGASHIVTLTATVPGGAGYGAAHVLDVFTVSVGGDGNPIAATADDGLHLVAYVGDATGNGAYSGLDAQRVARVDVGLDSGFRAYPKIDPTIVADVTGDGSLSGLDAQRIALQAADLNPREIPPMPQPLRLSRPRTIADGPRALSDARLTDEERTISLFGSITGCGSLNAQPGARLRVSPARVRMEAGAWGWALNERVALAARRVDTLAAVLHELGHVAGNGRAEWDMMEDSLPLGMPRGWDEEPTHGDPAECATLLSGHRLTSAAVDDFFAAT
jgi:hypothetical protein